MQASLASRLLRLVTLSLSLSLALPLTVPSKTGVQYPQNFISKIIAERTDPNGPVTMRFPPEPNGFLHLGHAKSICVNFGLNEQFNEDNVMRTNVRMDDTNPLKESPFYVDSITKDTRWLIGKDAFPSKIMSTSSYFDEIYGCAVSLIENGLAFVDDLSPDEMRELRGTLTSPGQNSPNRDRPVEDSLRLFQEMTKGEHPTGSLTLRAKIDMSSPNLNLRDPVIYRILVGATHHNTGDKWNVYPMYDFSHPISDAIEGITHSLCTLEFEDHRVLYDWVLDSLAQKCGKEFPSRPRQIEFSRLNLKYTVLSKRKLIQLVEQNHVEGWDDPRLPTLSGVRRRGFQPLALKTFCSRIGVSKTDSNIDFAELENVARETMDKTARRAFVVTSPLKVTITNYDSQNKEEFIIPRHPKDESFGERTVPFGKEIYIEESDFFDGENPPKGFKRLVAGGKVRLRNAYVITCEEVVRDENNKPIELLCTYDDRTGNGVTPEGEKRVQGIVQWVEATTSVSCDVAQYDRLFKAEAPGSSTGDFLDDINPDSVSIISGARCEPSVEADCLQHLETVEESQDADVYHGDLHYQFERQGYYALDSSSSREKLVFNRVVTLRDTWGGEAAGKVAKEGGKERRRGGGGGGGGGDEVAKDVERVSFVAAQVKSAEQHADAEALLICKVDVGEEEERTVVAGLAAHMTVEELQGKMAICVANLKPSKMRGVESQGMLLGVEDGENFGGLLEPPQGAKPGDVMKFEGFEVKPDAMMKSKGAVKCFERVVEGLKINDKGVAECGDGAAMVNAGNGLAVTSSVVGGNVK
ncbi:hypothetical protein TrVE_jg5496 [Triparma verrucosa]|uniref:glutamine--tRNA ligase n=1 Tax=Triparma verrucosa TaxID=1606542 RepID=A0A9W7FL80_9STRA|nr:hypothetical protein TrVE_jg5496 [Triparma verrucosa]